MSCAWRSSRAMVTGGGRSLAAALAISFVLVMTGGSSVQAQTPMPTPTPTPIPSPTPVPVPATINSDLSAGAAVANLGSSFLERLGDQASGGFGRAARRHPGGGGAS